MSFVIGINNYHLFFAFFYFDPIFGTITEEDNNSYVEVVLYVAYLSIFVWFIAAVITFIPALIPKPPSGRNAIIGTAFQTF